MPEEPDISKIVKEDILRILGETKKEVSLESIKTEIKVSDSFLSQAIKDLEEENQVSLRKNFLRLTADGQKKAGDIVKKHLVIENYFKRTKNEEEAYRIAHILEHYVSEEVIKNIKKLSTFKQRGVPLTELGLYKKDLITDIHTPDNKLFERVVSMGILPGEEIRITNKIPDGVIVEVKNKKFAIARDIAKEIKVLDHENP